VEDPRDGDVSAVDGRSLATAREEGGAEMGHVLGRTEELGWEMAVHVDDVLEVVVVDWNVKVGVKIIVIGLGSMFIFKNDG
jgi:hypothetical protein